MDEVQPYKFGTSEPQTPVSLSGMDRIGERVARQLRAMLETIIGTKPNLVTQPAEMVNYDLWSAMAPNFCSLSTYKLHPLKGTILVKLDAGMVTSMVERFYGGTGARPAPERGEFTRSEDRLRAKLSDDVMKALIAAWADLLPMDMSLASREHDPQALVFAEANDQLLSQTFTLAMGKGQDWTIELMFPVIALRQLEPLLATNAPDEIHLKDPLWQARLARQMGSIRMPAKTVLARPTLTLSELLNLKNGDVIPVTIERYLPLLVGNRVVAQGTLGEQSGRAAFMIEKMN
ncbi:MAG: flagellar motor switch protein FliM [Sphingobium sp.]|nr:flagellar motor switch protein FliM [Sphingobium sp.]MBP6111742.1 flagellar motor switch protein FliM [Sphingobium sp.]MBP8671289.1 flagellar motor switch protein FliM [Sphingobium sp.]MBP9158360.1 flagellar motor switch protein FliM [Sphingobium sp.]MCC6482471.1 flagellar motor switch protein FliM [Sphingomonadaceae bacterium]